MYEKFYNELYASGGFLIKSRDADGVFLLAHSCTIATGREQSFTPGGEPPLVPVPHPH